MSAEAADLSRRAPRITADDVFTAADALLGEGHRPTIDRVRVRLGRGSPNTINEHLEVWWRKLGARFRESAGLALPSMPEAISTRLIELWNLALRESHHSLQAQLAERETAVLARETAVGERETAVEGRLQAQAAALQLAQGQLEEANERARVLESTLQLAHGDAEQLGQQATTLQSELARLRRQIETASDRYMAERARLNERYDALQERSAREIDRLQLAHKDDKKQLKELRAQLERIADERDRSRAAVTRLEAELATTQRLNDRLLAAPRSSVKRASKALPTRRAAGRRATKVR